MTGPAGDLWAGAPPSICALAGAALGRQQVPLRGAADAV